MKKIIALIIVTVFCFGCTAMDATKDGVSATYGGIKTIGSDTLVGLGKVLSGGDITISIRTNAAYNDEVDK